jgi:phosphoribulokinase
MCTRKCLPLVGLVSVIALAGCQKSGAGTTEKTTAPTAAAAAPAGSTAAATTETKEAFGRLTVAELEAKIAAAKSGQLKLAVFDNNGRDTYDEGHVPTARWVQYDEIKATDLPADKDTQLVFYCYNEH